MQEYNKASLCLGSDHTGGTFVDSIFSVQNENIILKRHMKYSHFISMELMTWSQKI